MASEEGEKEMCSSFKMALEEKKKKKKKKKKRKEKKLRVPKRKFFDGQTSWMGVRTLE